MTTSLFFLDLVFTCDFKISKFTRRVVAEIIIHNITGPQYDIIEKILGRK